jgi:hypothetical protein
MPSILPRLRLNAVATLPNLTHITSAPDMHLAVNVNAGVTLALFRGIDSYVVDLLCRGFRPINCRLN